MKRYQLAKLVDWAGRLESRKRLQKVVYMLQAAGCQLDADFYLHRYGPYSDDVARLTDEMVRADLLKESETQISCGSMYTYQLPAAIKQKLGETEVTERGVEWMNQMVSFEDLAKSLFKADAKQLEYASTIVYFRKQGLDWPDAVARAEQFKQTPAVKDALGLAQSIGV